MSWLEPESGGGEGVVENPDPEEDSDLPARPRGADTEGEGLRSEQDRPEDDLALSTVEAASADNPNGDQTSNSVDGVNGQRLSPDIEERADECVGAGAFVQTESFDRDVGGGNGEGRDVVDNDVPVLQNRGGSNGVADVTNGDAERPPEAEIVDDAESRPVLEDLAGAGQGGVEQSNNRVVGNEVEAEEEDSFEQDEATAAPECENGVCQDSTSESDRQPLHCQTHPQEQLASETYNDAVENINRTYESSSAALPEPESYGNSINQGESALGATMAARNNVGNFSGNIQVLECAEDAPEAELGNLQSNFVPLRESGSSIFNAENIHSAVCEVAPQATTPEGLPYTGGGPSSSHSNLEHSRNAGDDHDMQAPECDRENSPQPPLNVEEPVSIGEPAQLQAVSLNQISSDIPTVSNSQEEAIASLPTNMCQQVNFTSDSSVEGAPSEQSPGHGAHHEPGMVNEHSTEGPQASSQDNFEEKSPDQNDIIVRKPDAETDSKASPEHSITKHLACALSANPNCSKDGSLQSDSESRPQPSENQDFAEPEASSVQCEQSPTSLSSSPIPQAVVKIGSEQKDLSSSVSEGSLPNAVNSFIPNAAQQKENNQKLSNSSSSSSTNTSQRTSPAKAVAAALFHVMGMDSKFTGKDLALALQSDDEDDLMSELDAELLSSSAPSTSKPKPIQKQTQKVQTRGYHKTKSKAVSKSESLQSVNGLPSSLDVQQLQEHNRQLLEQLRIRDEEIARLSGELKAKSDVSEESSVRSNTSSHSPDDLYLPQIKELEKTIAQQGAEIKSLTEKLYTHDTAAKRTVLSLQNEMKSRVDQATKMYDECRREKDMIVVKFAEAEAKNMEAKRVVEKSETKVRDALRERDNMASGLKAARTDRQRTIASYDAKCAEVSNLHKELEKMKEALSSSEYRIKWFQNKLKDELEAHKDTKGNLEKTNLRLKEAREETELIRKECQAIVKRYQESEEIKSNTLEKDLKLKESELQTHLQERNDSEELHQMLKQELESLKSQHKDTIEEAKTLRDKVKCLEEERQQNHSMIENYQEIMQRQKSDNTDLTSKLNSLTTLEDDYRRAQNMIQSLDKDMADLKVSNKDLQKDMDACRERESKMLTLQSELSRANAMLRSENTNLSNKASSLGNEVELLKMEVQQLDRQVKELTESLEAQEARHKENTEHLVLSLSQKTKESSDFKQKWEDEMDSSKTLKRRHANNIKDLTRQLQQARRKLDAHDGKADGGSMGSRTNSNGSLNSVDNTQQQQHHQHNHHHPQQAAPLASPQEFPVITEQVEVDKNVLIERIVRLQKSHARKNEKLEFLGEHIQQLLEEIKKKTKIIQTYTLREEAGTLSSDDMDAHKTLLARKGGIMASVYSVHQQDGSMTLDLSLQINKKLQAVLEDTLLKNITLKENLDTLGEEIARLSQENRRLQLHLQELESRPH